jgi:hypothetical protein
MLLPHDDLEGFRWIVGQAVMVGMDARVGGELC